MNRSFFLFRIWHCASRKICLD